jgi:hypothetical protein
MIRLLKGSLVEISQQSKYKGLYKVNLEQEKEFLKADEEINYVQLCNTKIYVRFQ